MNIRLDASATTIPKMRRYIQESDKPIAHLADEFGLSEDTIRRWKRRESVADRSHTPLRLQGTLTRPQEFVIVELRKTLLLPLDDLLSITRDRVHPDVSRSGLDR